ncbi:hypothetical protein MNBD_GAMMA09-1378 [hydrothermal vent metagenome]|uniref:Serine aminopeptidase S33 domain-containing protein n=1 Tax=hydrothermal vent metagenome TaxID=652676 RepID=A0A3B0XM89_9ZZZZ
MQKNFLVLVCMCLWITACTGLFFQPVKTHYSSPEQYGIEYEDIYFKGNSGLNLHGWWFPGVKKTGLKSSEVKSSRASVLFLHGNGQNISTHAGFIQWLTQYQYDVFIFDYRGYGKSEGEANINGALDDIQSARNYLASRYPADKKIFLLAHSLGASLGISSLAQYSGGIEGAIFVAPFSSYPKIAREMMSRSWITWAFQWLAPVVVSSDYNPQDAIQLIDGLPKLFIYSDEDQMIAPQHILDLYQLAAEPKSIARVNGLHNQIFARQETQRLIVDFLNQWSD